MAGGVNFAGCPGTAAQAADIRAGVTVARVNDWVAGAQARSQLLYGMGFSAAESAAEGVAARLLAMSEAGLVMLVAQRVKARADGDRMHPQNFLAIRTSVALPPCWPAMPVPPKRVAVTGIAGRR